LHATYSPRGFEQITDMDPAVGLTVPDGAQFASIQCEAADVRWRDDGTEPTSTVGMVLASGETMLYQGDLSAIRFFETSANSVLNVTYYA
jgi:hypothetical protein